MIPGNNQKPLFWILREWIDLVKKNVPFFQSSSASSTKDFRSYLNGSVQAVCRAVFGEELLLHHENEHNSYG